MKSTFLNQDQANRFQQFLNDLTFQVDNHYEVTLQDFLEYESEYGEMTFDTFKERLEIRLTSN